MSNGRTAPKKHQPGSIVRVTLTDFVTYTKAEFSPGPNLNMVIGPNGTGKSTLVCAICIGLGWATKHLGRGKDLDEFVKHGAKEGEIEIELAADPARHDRNPVITTRLRKGDKANAEYLINGKKANKKRVQELAMSFSIQVDNLCQFLPQDRVVEFASLSPVDLLTETQRAAAPQQMSDWHEQLKDWRKDQKRQQTEQQNLAEVIKGQEDRQRQQAPDVDRLRERAALQERKNALEKMRPLPEYREAKEKWTQAKERRKDAVVELTQLERRAEPNMAAVTQKQHYLETITQKTLSRRKGLVEKMETSVGVTRNKINNAYERIGERKEQIEAERNSMKGVKQSMPSLQRNVSSIKKAMEAPPAAFDAAEMNEQIREKTRQMRSVTDDVEAAQQEVGSIDEQMRQRTQVIDTAERQKKNLQSQAGQQMNKLQTISIDAAKAWEWIQANRGRFQGEVYGPPIVECRVRDERHAPAVESTIQQGDALAFTVTTKADFDMLTDWISAQRIRGLNVRSSIKDLDFYKPPTTTQALQQYGLQGWLLELLEGPEPVLAMLCDNRNIHQTAYTFRDVSHSQLSALQQSPISSWVTSKQSYMISRRREYGDKATSTRVQDLKQARFFTKASVDHQQDSDLDRRIAEAQGEIDELNESRLAKMEEVKVLRSQLSELKKAKAAIEQEKNTKQSALSQFNALPTKLELAESKLTEARAQLTGSTERRMAIEKEHDTICLEKGQHALDYANAVDSLRNLHIQLFEAEILAIEAGSDLERLQAQHQEEQRLLDERRAEVDQLRARETELLATGRRLQAQCNELAATFEEAESAIWEELQEWTLGQLDTELVSLTARLDVLVGGGNEKTIREFEKRKQEIEDNTRKFNELAATLDELEAQITDVREQWEPQLDDLIEDISAAFAENFSKIQCAGEVGVYKHEDFEHWAIQIKVKFRYMPTTDSQHLSDANA